MKTYGDPNTPFTTGKSECELFLILNSRLPPAGGPGSRLCRLANKKGKETWSVVTGIKMGAPLCGASDQKWEEGTLPLQGSEEKGGNFKQFFKE